MADKKAEEKKESKAFKGIVVPSEGLFIGAKNTKGYKKGETFETDNESLYLDLIKRKKIK